MLDKFKTKIRGAEFELVSFHSCSMSGLEVAFELQGTAKYMLASQGPAFVGTWPYTAILLRVFNDVDEGSLKTQRDIEAMIEDVYRYVKANSADFVMAGYSFDLCLCDLSRGSIASVEKPLKDLSKELIQGLTNDLTTACILLAHWKSQSYWNENYTDLYDYCFCLSDYCAKFKKAVKDPRHYKKIQDACDKVMKALEERYRLYPGRLVIFSDFVGPESQYSHGFSIFFPWTRPTADRAIWTEYKDYKFKGTDWHTFLKKYWGPEKYEDPVTGTMRDSHQAEVSKPRTGRPRQHDPLLIRRNHLDEDILSWMFNADGPLNIGDALNDGSDKPHSQSSTGDGCTCGAIKNYRRDTRARFDRGKGARPALPMSPGAVGPKIAGKKA